MRQIAIHLGAQVVALIAYTALIAFVVWGESPAYWGVPERLLTAMLWLIVAAFTALTTHMALGGDIA